MSRDEVEAAIATYLRWYEETFEDVPSGLYDEVGYFLDQAELGNVEVELEKGR